MRDAIGGIVNLVIIVVFLVIVSGYLAFNVNYTKAFRVKNKIISTIEEYEGNCPADGKGCDKIINDYINSMGYDNTNLINCDSYNTDKIKYYKRNGYCVGASYSNSQSNIQDKGQTAYFKVKTYITIDMPIIRNVIPNIGMFEITGDTKTVKCRTYCDVSG